MGRRLGLIIGINHYQDPTFRPLQFAETDARALAQWLVHVRGGQWNPADVQVLLGAEATRDLVESLLAQLCLHMATSEDLVLIYVAGYAFLDQSSGEGYLACSNTSYQEQSGVHLFTLVSQIFARSAAAQIICILDCCQMGQLWNMRRASPFDFQPLLGPTLQRGLQQIQGRMLYCSCRGTEAFPEVGEKNLGTFMYRLVMGVGGPALDPTSGQVTLQNLHTFLCERLDEQHRPQVFGQEPRPLVLVGDLPAFQTGTLAPPHSGSLISPSAPLGQPGAPIAVSSPNYAGLNPASTGIRPGLQGSPSTSSLGQTNMATIEQNRQQQLQQMLNQARQLVQMQNLQQAYQLTESVLQMQPTLVEALILKTQILGAIGQFDEALTSVKQIIQLDPENALGWSMAAALLANTGQLPEAMSAVDRSLSLDPSNSETHAIKEMIREKLTNEQFDTGKRSRLVAPEQKANVRDSMGSFLLGFNIQLFGLIIGTAGAFLLLIKPDLPDVLGFLLESAGLALLTVNAWRGTYVYGWKRLLLVIFFSLVTLGLAGALYKVKRASDFIINHVSSNFHMMIPLAFLVLWLAAAAVLPLLLAVLGWITGMIVRARHRRA